MGRITATGRSPRSPRPVAVALGSNLGDRRAHLAYAIGRLGQVLSDLRVSSFHETDPVGVAGPQPPFLNAAAVGWSALPAASLLETLLAIEAERGRERPHPGAARTLDLDLILCGDEIVGADDVGATGDGGDGGGGAGGGDGAGADGGDGGATCRSGDSGATCRSADHGATCRSADHGATCRSPLRVPHPRFRERGFVLDPLVEIAADLRDPVTGRTIRELHAALSASGRPAGRPDRDVGATGRSPLR